MAENDVRKGDADGCNANGEDCDGSAERYNGDANAPARDGDAAIALQLPLRRSDIAKLRAGDACLLTGPLFTLRDAGHIRLLAELDAMEPGAAAIAECETATHGECQTAARAECETPARAECETATRAECETATHGECEAAAPAHAGTATPAHAEAPVLPNREKLPYGLEGQAIFYAGPTPPAAGRPFGAIGPTTAGRMDFAAPRLYDAGVAATIGKGVRAQQVKDACVRNGAVYFIAVGGAAAYLAKCVESSKTLAYDDLGTEALRRVEVKDFPVFVGIDTCGNDVYDRAGA